MMDKIVKETKYLNEDSDFVKFMSVEEEDRLYINTWKAEGREEKTKEIVKSLLKENSSIDFISRVTGLSINEINKIKNDK